MAERPAFQQTQYRFAAHLRDPRGTPAPRGIEDRRMAIYRDLFFNNVAQLLARTFPVLHGILAGERWQRLMRDYFGRHQSRTPLFLEMPREFLNYLEHERAEHDDDPPFMLELAHYEWVELALSIDEREAPVAGIDTDGDLLEGRPALNPLHWSLSYRFPVHRLSPQYTPAAAPPEPTRLLVYRNLDDEVGFMEINVVTARLLELLADERIGSGHGALERIAIELKHPQPETVIRGGREILDELRRRQVVLGTVGARGSRGNS
jgi:hypothetical protein